MNKGQLLMMAKWVIIDLKKDIFSIMTKIHKVVINYWTWKLETNFMT